MHLERHARRAIGLILSAAIAAGLAGVGIASTAHAATTPTFRLAYNFPCATIRGGAGQAATIQQLDATGVVIESFSGTLDVNGNLTECFDELWHAGMRVRGSLDGGAVRTVTLPKLSVRINRVTDVVSGVGPAGKTVVLSILHHGSFTSTTSILRSKTISSTGTYSRDFTSLVNIIGGDYVGLDYETTVGDLISTYELAPLVKVWLGRANFGTQVLSGTGGKVVLRTSSGAFRGSGYTMYYSADAPTWDYEVFQTSAGTPVTARVGDRVSSTIQSDMAFTIPKVTIAGNATTGHIAGVCPANKKMQWTVYQGSGNQSTKYVGAGACPAHGTYDIDLSGNGGIDPGQPVELTVRLSTGDLVARRAYGK